ncbi:MAG: hypothetical protein WB755_26040 [Terriglobales bacterium]|jgi:hypothetical protein
MPGTIENQTACTTRFGQELEDLVYNVANGGRLVVRAKNDDLLLSYWSLVFEYCKGIVCLVAYKFHAPAVALLRPLVDALVRAHIVLIGSEEDVTKIRKDRFKVSYEKDGAKIDKGPRHEPYIRKLPQEFAEYASQSYALGHCPATEAVG